MHSDFGAIQNMTKYAKKIQESTAKVKLDII